MSRTLTPRSGRTSGRGRTPSTRRRHSVSRARGRRVLPRAPSSAHDALAAPPRRRARAIAAACPSANAPPRSRRHSTSLPPARGDIRSPAPPRSRRARVRPGRGRTRARDEGVRAGGARGRTRGVDRARPAASRAPRRGVSFRRRSQFLSYRRVNRLATGSSSRHRISPVANSPPRARRARPEATNASAARARRRALAAAVVVVAAPGCSAQTVFTTLADLKNAVATCNSNGGLCNEASTWDVSQLTSLNGAFQGYNSFNADISGWDVSRVTDMEGTFENAGQFDQDISGWDVSSVTTMKNMFKGANQFDQDT